MQAEKGKGKVQTAEPKVRTLKIQPKYRFNVYREAIIHPEIKLCGVWLRNLGFDCDKRVSIIPEGNTLIIKLVEE